jgi:hypothetical protein
MHGSRSAENDIQVSRRKMPSMNTIMLSLACAVGLTLGSFALADETRHRVPVAIESDESKAIAEIERAGGRVVRDESDPLRPAIAVSNYPVSDAAMEQLARLRHLRELNLHNCRVTDAALEQVGRLTLLETFIGRRRPH